VRLQAAVQPRADGAVTVSAETEIDRSAWGMTWTRMGAGIHNRVTIEATFIRS
jgi:polyisoprenoid-binding protein YceI